MRKNINPDLVSKKEEIRKVLLVTAKLAKLPKLCQLDYQKHVDSIFINKRYQSIKYIDVKGTELVILQNDNVVYVSFRGTDFHYTDLIPHMLMFSTKTPYGKIHKGYWSKFISILPYLKKYLSNAEKPIKNIYFIGHSLGGALAQIAYLYARRNWHPEYFVGCVTFGSCKPIKKLKYPLAKYRNLFNNYLKKDYVGLFPFGFHNIKKGIILEDECLVNDKCKIYKNKTLPFLGLLKSLFSIFINKKHSIDEYIKRLEK